MQITENLLLGKTRHGYGITYEGLLLPNLQPVLYAVGEGSRSCIYFSQFGNNFFLRPWNLEQDKLDNIVKLGEASHKIIKNEEVEFLLAYNEVKELTLDFLYDLKTTKRCTFILTLENLQKVVASIDNFSINFKKRIRTYQYKEDSNKMRDNYVFTLSLYSIDTIVANLKNKEVDGVGVAIEIFNKQYTQHYKTVYVSYGCHLVFTNTYEDVLYRDCVEILPQNSIDAMYIYEQISCYEKYCGNKKEDKKLEEYLTHVASHMASSKIQYKVPSSIGKKAKKEKAQLDNEDVPIFENDAAVPVPAQPPPQYGSYEDDMYVLEDISLEYASEIKQDHYAKYAAELKSVLPIQEPQKVDSMVNEVVQAELEAVDDDIKDLHKLAGKTVKKYRNKNSDDLWLSLDEVHEDMSSLKIAIPKISKSFEEYKQEQKLAKKVSKEDLYRKLYGGTLKAAQEEMLAEISEEIVEKQKIREQAKTTTAGFYSVDTSATTAYTGVGFSTIKYTMN